MATFRTTLSSALVLAMACAGPPAEPLDLVLANGRVMDPESGLDAIRNVGIRDGKIVAISEEELKGDRIIDAAGRVVAPGFIDLHSHGHTSLIGGRVQAFDGVTTAFEAEAGQLPIDAAYQKAATEGRVKVGADADLIVFDPAAIRSNATQERPSQPSTGMGYVIVNGTVLIDQGRLDPSAHPGRPIRRP